MIWTRTAERRTWVAEAGNAVLTVSRKIDGSGPWFLLGAAAVAALGTVRAVRGGAR